VGKKEDKELHRGQNLNARKGKGDPRTPTAQLGPILTPLSKTDWPLSKERPRRRRLDLKEMSLSTHQGDKLEILSLDGTGPEKALGKQLRPGQKRSEKKRKRSARREHGLVT